MDADTQHLQTPMESRQCREQALSLMHLGRMDDGLGLMQSYVEQHPGDAMTHSMLLFFTHYLSTYDKQQLFEGYRQWASRQPENGSKSDCFRVRSRSFPGRFRFGAYRMPH